MREQKRAELVSARNAAWANVNAALDHNGSRDTPEYREAFTAWEAAAHAVIDHDEKHRENRHA